MITKYTLRFLWVIQILAIALPKRCFLDTGPEEATMVQRIKEPKLKLSAGEVCTKVITSVY